MRQRTILGEFRYGNQLVTFEGEMERDIFHIEILNTFTYKSNIKKFTKLVDAKKYFEISITSIFPLVKTKELKENL